jgi:hypothetical protein
LLLLARRAMLLLLLLWRWGKMGLVERESCCWLCSSACCSFSFMLEIWCSMLCCSWACKTARQGTKDTIAGSAACTHSY